MIRKTKYGYANVVKKRKQAKGHGYANIFRHIHHKNENYEEMLADNTRLEVAKISKKASWM